MKTYLVGAPATVAEQTWAWCPSTTASSGNSRGGGGGGGVHGGEGGHFLVLVLACDGQVRDECMRGVWVREEGVLGGGHTVCVFEV